jgi:hypothetical protein
MEKRPYKKTGIKAYDRRDYNRKYYIERKRIILSRNGKEYYKTHYYDKIPNTKEQVETEKLKSKTLIRFGKLCVDI